MNNNRNKLTELSDNLKSLLTSELPKSTLNKLLEELNIPTESEILPVENNLSEIDKNLIQEIIDSQGIDVLRKNLLEYADLLYQFGIPESFSSGSPKYFFALYVRFSKDMGDTSTSVINQIRKLAMYISDNITDYVIVDLYIDDGYTGTDFDRSEYQRMHDDVKRGIVNSIIIIDITRYARNLGDGITQLAEYVLTHKIRFISTRLPEFDTLKDPKAISSGETYDALSQAEGFARTTSIKVRDDKVCKARAGEFSGGFPVYGYKRPERYDDRKIFKSVLIDSEPAEVVQKIFTWYLEGLSPHAIAKRLNELGILNPASYKRSVGLNYCTPQWTGSKLWCSTTISHMLKDKNYIGCTVHHKSSSFDHLRHKQVSNQKEDYVVVPNRHEPIITEDDFYRVAELMNQRTRVTKSGKAHLFANLVHCSTCGKAMRKTSSKNIAYLVCRTYTQSGKDFCSSKRTINMKTLEEKVFIAIKMQISLVEKIQTIVERVNAKTEISNRSLRIEKLLENRNKALLESQRLQDKFYFDSVSGIISKEQYERIRQQTENEQAELRKVITKLLDEQQRVAQGIKNNDNFFERFLKYKNIELLDRDVLIELVSRIEINEDKSIKILFRFENQYQLILDYIFQNEEKQAIESDLNSLQNNLETTDQQTSLSTGSSTARQKILKRK